MTRPRARTSKPPTAGWSRRAPALSVIGLGLCAACATPRLAVPSAERTPAPTETSTFALELRSLSITNLSPRDPRSQLIPLRAALLDRLAGAGARPAASSTTSTAPSPSLWVHLRPEVSVERTYVLDALAAVPGLGLFPLTPEWGTASVSAEVRLERDEAPSTSAVLRAEADYSYLFYSWYRDDALRQALERAYHQVFMQVARLVAAELSAPSAPRPSPPDGGPPPTEEGFRVITRPATSRGEPSLLARYVGALGGLEGALTGGGARVSSRARTPAGEERVGEGEATTSGFRLAFFRPPSKTGFFFPPLFGFFSQDIDISGFSDVLPVHQVPNATTVGVRVTDPETFAPVDLGQPLSYSLRLRSGYLGQGLGLNLVVGTDEVELFGTLRLGLNLVELRHTDVTLETARELGWSFAFASSGQLGLQGGLTFPGLHLSVRAAVELEYFRAFAYPRPLEFQASTTWNPEKQVFERARAFVDGAELTTLNWQLSLTYLF